MLTGKSGPGKIGAERGRLEEESGEATGGVAVPGCRLGFTGKRENVKYQTVSFSQPTREGKS